MIATLKHFPGHGDTDVDSHLGLPIIKDARDVARSHRVPAVQGRHCRRRGRRHDRAHRDARARSGAEHADDAEPADRDGRAAARDGLRRDRSTPIRWAWPASTALYKPGDAAVRAIKAGNDIVLHSPDDGAAFAGIKAAVESGEIPLAQIDKSVERILRAKARTGLNRTRAVNLDALAEHRRRPRAPGRRGRGQPEVDHAGSATSGTRCR